MRTKQPAKVGKCFSYSIAMLKRLEEWADFLREETGVPISQSVALEHALKIAFEEIDRQRELMTANPGGVNEKI